MSNNQGMDANRRLAIALGWTNITEAGGALLGMPPWAAPNSRGQAAVPNWAGDWRECGPLMVRHLLAVGFAGSFIMAHSDIGAVSEGVQDCGGCRDMAARAAIVQAVCDKLEAGQ